jgi:hypothetical protein
VDGVAINIRSTLNSLLVDDCKFNNLAANNGPAPNYGGAICIKSLGLFPGGSRPEINITDSVFDNCVATYGNSIYIDNPLVYFSGCKFISSVSNLVHILVSNGSLNQLYTLLLVFDCCFKPNTGTFYVGSYLRNDLTKMKCEGEIHVSSGSNAHYISTCRDINSPCRGILYAITLTIPVETSNSTRLS